MPRPTGRLRTEQDAPQFSDGEMADFSRKPCGERASERLAYAIFNQAGARYFAEAERRNQPSRILALALVVRAADEQVAFLELVGAGKELLEMLRIHLLNQSPGTSLVNGAAAAAMG